MQEIRTGYDRVTEILYHFSGLSSVEDEKVSNAAARGSVIHYLCESLAFKIGIYDGEIDELIREYTHNEEHFFKEKKIVQQCLISFRLWCDGKKFIEKPDRFYDDEYMITGECDLIYVDENGELVLVDLKTPVYESKTWALQGSAYVYMAKKIGLNISRFEFVKLCRIGKKPMIFKYENHFNLFLATLQTYRYFFKN